MFVSKICVYFLLEVGGINIQSLSCCKSCMLVSFPVLFYLNSQRNLEKLEWIKRRGIVIIHMETKICGKRTAMVLNILKSFIVHSDVCYSPHPILNHKGH